MVVRVKGVGDRPGGEAIFLHVCLVGSTNVAGIGSAQHLENHDDDMESVHSSYINDHKGMICLPYQWFGPWDVGASRSLPGDI